MYSRIAQAFAKRAAIAFFALLAVSASPITLSQPSDVQPGYENAGLPRAEFLLGDLRAYVGRKFWVRRPAQGQSPFPLFCDATSAPVGKECPREKFSIAGPEAFTVDAVTIAKPDAGLSWLKIRLESGKAGYLSLQDFVHHRYNEGRVSATLHGIDYALAHSGWIFDDYPPKILDLRRAQFDAATNPQLALEKLEKDRVMRLKLLYLGMTAQQVLNSTWGRPNRITSSSSSWQRLDHWDYGGGTVLIFENDRLLRIETARR